MTPHGATSVTTKNRTHAYFHKVSACVKHFVFNNEEDDRGAMSSNVGNRAAKELYYKPFAAAVDAGAGSAMCRSVGTWGRKRPPPTAAHKWQRA